MEAAEQSPPSAVSLREAVCRVIAELSGPITRKELLAQVLARHPSHARRPEDLILAEIRRHPDLVRLDDGSFASRNWVLNGFAFRYCPTPEEIRTGEIGVFPCFTPFLPTQDSPHTSKARSPVTIRDEMTGTLIAAKVPTEQRTISLGPWLAGQGFVSGDSLILTIADSAQAVFLARREAAEQTNRMSIEAQNDLLEAAIVDLVTRNTSEQPFIEEIIPAALARLKHNAQTSPGSHWHRVVTDSTRLRVVDDYAISRATFRRPIDRLLGYAASKATRENLEGRIDAFNADVERVLGSIGARAALAAPPGSPCGRDEALHRSTRQIATYLATLPVSQQDCYRCLAIPSIYLAKHEGTSLADADFEMLCRFLLSYYPRRVFFNRKSFTSRMLATLRHFYAANPTSRAPMLVSPRHLSRLHSLVDRKIGLYAELDMDGPDSQRLFTKLFPHVDADDAEVLPLNVGEIVLASR